MKPLIPILAFLNTVGPFVITSVSQTAGKAAGGTVVIVTATGIVGTPTSTLGAVSNVTTSSFHITTVASAPGSTLNWTVTNGNGTVASTLNGTTTLTYNWLGVPVAGTVTPNNGPATLANTVSINAANLPPLGSGCPIAATLGSGTSSGVSQTSTAAFTATMSAPGIGDDALVVIVDGVSSVPVTGVFTGNSPPVISSIGIVGVSGGDIPMSGSFFASGITATITISGVPTSTPIAFNASNSCTLTVPALTAGSYTVTVTNTGTDGQSGSSVNGLQVSNISSPEVIFTTDLVADWDMTKSNHTGSTFNYCPDQSGNSHTLGKGGAPIFNTVDPDGNYGGQPSVSLDGVSAFLTATGLPISAHSMTAYICGYVYGTTANFQSVMNVEPGTGALTFTFQPNNPIPVAQYTTSPDVVAPTAYAAIPFIAVFAVVGTGTTTNNISLSMNAQTPATALGAAVNIPTSPLSVFIGQLSGSAFTRMTVIRAGLIQRAITSTELSELVQFLNLTHQVDLPPTIGVQPSSTLPEMTNIRANGGTQFRIAGENFATSGVTASVNIGGTVTTLTIPADEMREDSLGFTGFPSTPAGTAFAITVKNPDGSGLVQNIPGSFITTTPDPMTEGGLSCVLWIQDRFINAAGNPPVNGDSIKQGFNKALLSANDPIQTNGSQQPTYIASNPLFNNQPTLNSVAANQQQLVTNTLDLLGNTTNSWVMTVCRQTTISAAFEAVFTMENGTTFDLSYYASGNLALFTTGGADIPWTSNLGTTVNELMVRFTGGTSTVGLNVNNSGEQTITNSTVIYNPCQFEILGRAAATQYMDGQMACIVVWTSPPNSLADIHTFAQTLGAP